MCPAFIVDLISGMHCINDKSHQLLLVRNIHSVPVIWSSHRIYGLFGYLMNFWVVPISLNILKLNIYPEFDLNFGYMVNF